MRKLTVNSVNTQVEVTSWSVYINNKNLDDLVRKNLEQGTFRARVNIVIEEIEEDLLVYSNKPEEIKEVETDQE